MLAGPNSELACHNLELDLPFPPEKFAKLLSVTINHLYLYFLLSLSLYLCLIACLLLCCLLLFAKISVCTFIYPFKSYRNREISK